MVKSVVRSLAVLLLCTTVSTHAAGIALYPEEEQMKRALEEEHIQFPVQPSYNTPLTEAVASSLIYGVSGHCGATCSTEPLFATGAITQGAFLEQLYRKEMPTRAETTAKKFPGLKGSQMVYVRDAWQLGLIDTYNADKKLTTEEALQIIYRYIVLQANENLGFFRYQEGLVYDPTVITPYFYQSQDHLNAIIASYDTWIKEEKKSKRKQELQKRRDAFAKVLAQVVQDDATYQQRPFGLPLQADMGTEVVVTYGFHDPRYTSHTGVDIAPFNAKKAALGDIPVLARQSGIAIFVKWDVPSSAGNLWSYTRNLNGYGNHVIILSEDFFRRIQGDRSLSKEKEVFATLYGHLETFGTYDAVENPVVYLDLMKKFYFGEKNVGNSVFKNLKIVGVRTVNVGDVIGVMGSTGRSTGEHLHYEVRKIVGDLATAEFQNPLDFHLDIPHSEVVFDGSNSTVAQGGGGSNINQPHDH